MTIESAGVDPGDEASAAPQELSPALAALAAVFGVKPERQMDAQLGDGVIFHLGPDRQTSVELYPHIVRVSLPQAQLAIPHTDIVLTPTGVVFAQPERFHLALSAEGAIVFQAPPPPAAAPEMPGAPGDSSHHPVAQPTAPPHRSAPSVPSQGPSRTPSPPAAETPSRGERYVGRLGTVTTHTTKGGKLVAEVALTVDDPEHPGASRLVTFVAFDAKAEALRDTYQPGQLVTAVGIAHELTRRARDGRVWTERQLYLVQLPKRHE